jgi:hypothetical protein
LKVLTKASAVLLDCGLSIGIEHCTALAMTAAITAAREAEYPVRGRTAPGQSTA